MADTYTPPALVTELATAGWLIWTFRTTKGVDNHHIIGQKGLHSPNLYNLHETSNEGLYGWQDNDNTYCWQSSTSCYLQNLSTGWKAARVRGEITQRTSRARTSIIIVIWYYHYYLQQGQHQQEEDK